MKTDTRIIAMSRHQSRQQLAREFAATDIVSERGKGGITRIKELTGGPDALLIEAVGTQESMMQAIRSPAPAAMSATSASPTRSSCPWSKQLRDTGPWTNAASSKRSCARNKACTYAKPLRTFNTSHK